MSPHLDVVVSDDNQRFLRLKPHDINMYRVLQESSVKRGKRRRVARRCLNALGGVTGMCGILNDDKKLKEIEANLKFAASLEEVKYAEKEIKRQTVEKKMQKHFDAARAKAGLKSTEQFFQEHADKLTIPQMKAVAYMICGGVKIKGKAAEVRAQLKKLLPMSPRISEHKCDLNRLEAKEEERLEYATQDEYFSASSVGSTTEDDPEIVCDIQLQDMRVGDCVEVYWEGESTWFEGVIKEIDSDDNTFRMYYPQDKDLIWHSIDDYPVRMAC